MEQLPDELCLHILRYVSLEDLTLRCSATSRALRRISDDADLWHHHLYRYHPRWRDALQDMGVDATVTPLRECVRRLTEAHDPDGVSGCCRHDLTKGAACTCCTCRRHHRQRWQWGVLSSLVNDINDEMRQMIAAAYDANAATSLQLTAYDDELRRQRRRRRLQRRGGGRRRRRCGGGGGSSGSDDDDRRRELITELERMGFLELRNKGSRLESVRWTKAAHRDLRPPLQRGLVCYTDAELYANLMRYHPELCDDTGLDRHGGLLERCGEGTKSIDEIYSKTVNYRRAFSFGGASTPAAAPSIGGGLFGPTVPSTSPFGATTSTGTSRSSLFGGGGGTSSLFGGAGTGASTTSTSLFGAPAASTGTTGGLFGGSSFDSTRSATSSGFPSLGGFGAGTTSTFGAPAASTGSSLFGGATTGGAGSGLFPGFSSTTRGASSGLGSLDGLGGAGASERVSSVGEIERKASDREPTGLGHTSTE